MSDPRFARLKSDPRFRKPKKSSQKVVVDDRFRSVFETQGKKKKKSGSGVDKYGRRISDSAQQDDLRRFYRLDGEEDDDQAKLPDLARGEGLVESSDEEEKAGSSDEEGYLAVGGDKAGFVAKDTAEDEINLDENELADLDAQAASYQRIQEDESHPRIEPTNRLAIVNLDWDHVRATHLFKICSSLVSPTASALASTSTAKMNPARQLRVKGATNPIARGKVISVKIYPSQFGKERMEREEREGPPVELFKKKPDLEEDEINEHNIYEFGDDETHDEDALRRYQIDRLRYYYAIVSCDTSDAAAHIYAELEGTELERSANVFDMSFVPTDMTFDEEPRDEATEDPNVDYRAVEFVTDALRHSKVKLTWDEDDAERNQVTRRRLTQKDIDKGDFRAYLASSSESEGEEEVGKKASRDKLRSLLLGGGEDEMPEGWGRGDGGDGDGVDMEVTFTPALSATKEGEETTLEKYARKMKEKKKRRKEELKEKTSKSKESLPKDEFFGSDGEDDSVAEGEEEEEEKAAPEVVVEDEIIAPNGASGPKHFNMQAIIKSEKKIKGRRKKSKTKEDTGEDETQQDFTMDVKDPRFNVLFDDHNFAIDPTNPRYKKTKGMSALIQERSHRQQNKKSRSEQEVDDSHGLSKLVDSVKRKSSTMNSASGKRRKYN